ncbi:sulfotransferase family protein [Promicromonospora kroppenstedtii]|uniref:Sulfotransferase family protein n=1 Tax=Promicromonospora kroppenstedtii TaxID=440482 RepID=A0ABW7XK86_9MICO
MTAGPRVVCVTGPGNSGTSTLAGALRQFGLTVPRPEVPPDAPDPRGPSEPQWVVDFHEALLRAADVQQADPRPLAWHLVDRAGAEADAPGQIRAWLAARTAEHGDLVIKDPRLLWFLEHWQAAAAATGAVASCVTVLRPPTEVVGSRVTDDGDALVDRLAGWINLMLGTELATRATPRAFVRYWDLIHDWDSPVFDAAAALDLPMVDPRDTSAVERVDAFIDHTLHRVEVTWDEMPVPAPLRALADDTWAALDALPEHDDAVTRAEFDRLRALYPYVHRKVTASPARRIARMVPPAVVPSPVRTRVAGMLGRAPYAG